MPGINFSAYRIHFPVNRRLAGIYVVVCWPGTNFATLTQTILPQLILLISWPIGRPPAKRQLLEFFWKIGNYYSRVHISSDTAFLKILKKPSIVKKKMIPYIKGLDFSQIWSKKKFDSFNLCFKTNNFYHTYWGNIV